MSKRRIHKIFVVTALAVVSLGLLLTAWPKLQASIRYLPVDTAINNYYSTQEIPIQQIPELITRAQQAIEYNDHYRYNEGISLLYYLYGIDSRSPTIAAREALEKSLVAAKKAVSSAPARPMIWLRIAYLQALLRQPAEGIIAALKMSIYTGRVEPTLFLQRLELGVRYLQWMDEEVQALMRDQLLLSWNNNPKQLTTAITAQRINWVNVQALFAGRNPATLKEMEATIGSIQ